MEFSKENLELIQKLAAEGFSMKGIAVKLKKNPIQFRLFCLDLNHPIGNAYQRGVLKTERKKNKSLSKEIKKGSETAIQIHDKRSKEAYFLDIKNDLFSDLNG